MKHKADITSQKELADWTITFQSSTSTVNARTAICVLKVIGPHTELTYFKGTAKKFSETLKQIIGDRHLVSPSRQKLLIIKKR